MIQHTQVVQSPIDNGCLKSYIDGKLQPQSVPKFLFQVSVRELHNRMVGLSEGGVMKESRYA